MPLLLSPAPSPTPSPAILEFLAQLSSPPPPPNSPPTPAFLCPACDKPNLSSARRRRQLSTSTPTTAVTPLVPPHSQQSNQHHRSKTSNNYYSSLVPAVPPKFEQSADGYWYPATSWSFHGKTSQPNLLSTPTSTHTPALPSVPSNVGISTQTADLDDDNATSTIPYDDSSIESSIIDVTSDYDAIKDSLPTGWTIPPHRTKFYSIPVIVVVSLILAILLSLVIAGCVLGHKAKSGLHSEGRQSLKKILNEAKARANAQKSVSRTTSRTDVSIDTEGGDPELEILSDSERAEKILKQVKRKERLWDKWRNKNGKLSDLGLRRRKKKAITPTIPTMPSVSTVNQVTASIPEVPENDSPAIPVLSPSSNTSSSNLPGGSGSPANLVHSSPLPTNSLPKASHTSLSPQLALSTPLSIPSSTPGSTSQWHLPAYRHGTIANISSSLNRTHVNQADANEPLKGTPPLEKIQQFDQVSQTQQILDDCPRPDYPPPVLLQSFDLPHRAHVATDDKATLEMMRKGIGEPQQNVDASTSLAAVIPPLLLDPNSRPSVPVWVDELLEDFQDSMDVLDRDNDVKTPSSSKGQLHLPPLPSTDLQRYLERHYYNIPPQSGDFPGQSSPSLQPSLSYQSQPSTSSFNLSSSSLYLQPSAPALEDTEEFDLHSSRQPRPSAPPLLSDEDEDEANSLDNETDDRDERPSRWDRETDLEASLIRTQSTPGITAVSARNSAGPPYSRSRRRRSLSASSTTTFSAVIDPSSIASKRLSLPRYEP